MEIGDYVRTKYGIAKYIRDKVTKNTIYFVIDKPIVYDNVEGYENCLCSNEIIKSSPNIIDLIEVGDYVNGHKVLDIYEDINGEIRMKFGENGLILAHKSNYDNYYLFEEDIKSIVTKEQFKEMEYKI